MAEKLKPLAPPDPEARARVAFTLRTGGATPLDIAQSMNISLDEARESIALGARLYSSEVASEPPEIAKLISLSRLDALILIFHNRASSGDPKAGQLVLALERRREELTEHDLDSWKRLPGGPESS